jgi:hypothetical protein
MKTHRVQSLKLETTTVWFKLLWETIHKLRNKDDQKYHTQG